MNENKIRVLKVSPGQHPEPVMLENTLEALQAAVGGYIEIFGYENVCILLNEEGKLIGLEGNRRLGDDILVGDFYICGDDGEGDFMSLTDEEIERYTEMFYEPQEFTPADIKEASKVSIITFEWGR